jgi:hypothetical protein
VAITVDITADLNMVDETGYVWTPLDEARDPSVIFPGAIVSTGDADQPAVSEVIDVVDAPAGKIVHLDGCRAAWSTTRRSSAESAAGSRSAEANDLGEVDPSDHDPRPEPHVR